MDSTINIKKKIHEFVDDADERILRIFSAIIRTEEEIATTVSETFYKELDKRRDNHLHGKSKSFTWEETKDRARDTIK